MKIINVKNFPEYTAVFVNKWKDQIPEVMRCNMVCSDCWVKISENLWKKLEWFATTFRWWKCDMCWKKWYITNIRHYN